MILGIDPGPRQPAWVLVALRTGRILNSAFADTGEVSLSQSDHGCGAFCAAGFHSRASR
ncbi:MAG TPA: hypothetical protein VKB79_15310 [Bryobacteraceae bacterium]|nr:hypothetical protein [Bryobacteraceae bacterium]